jgi:large subunit ribosomal protein L24
MKRIKKDDLVKVISGGSKGKTAKVTRVDGDKVYLENVNVRSRHIAANRLNKQGGKKDVQLPLNISNVALVIEDAKGEKTSKVSYQIKNDKKTRVAKLNNKEVK